MQSTNQKLDLSLPTPVQRLVDLILEQGFDLYLVGGPVRDFLFSQKISTDLDFEIRHPELIDLDQWLEDLHQLHLKIQSSFDVVVEKLPFGIFKFELGEFQCEFASPRVEKYDPKKKAYHHSDFEVEIKSNLAPSKALARRDFTINAMAYDFKLQALIDPYNGQEDLKQGLLKGLHSDFEKDPVRLLRAFRFQDKFNLTICPETTKKLSKMNLSLLSDFAFQKEVHKSLHPITVLQKLKVFFEKKSIAVSSSIKQLMSLPVLASKPEFSPSDSLIYDCVRLSQRGMDQKYQNILCDFFRWKRKDLKTLLTLQQDCLDFEQHEPSFWQRSYQELVAEKTLISVKRMIEVALKNDAIALKIFKSYPKSWSFVEKIKDWESWEQQASELRETVDLQQRSLLSTALFIKSCYAV